MPAVSAAAVLDLWERAEPADPIDRALALAAGSEPVEEVAALPLGRRDARLLALHAALGGGELDATADCPACGARVEFAAAVDALLAAGAAAAEPVEVAGVEHWRPPDSRDLAAAAAAGSAEEAERVLLERCAGGPLDPVARAALTRAMAEADPLAEVLVDLACPACEQAFVADLDVASFVWTRVRAQAHRVLAEIDTLARAYGWREADVLALSDARRRTYLRLARGELA